MYAPRGIASPEVADIEPVPFGDKVHLFHLTRPNRDIIQHAVSNDGLAWEALPNAIQTGDPGDCDDDALQTMSVTERDGIYYMLYSAAAREEDALVQRTALATSTDLMHWTKHLSNPVAEADGRWYEADLSASGRVSWRDPKPILVGDTYYATLCARERSGPILRRGCVGLVASKDLVKWEVRPPLFTPRQYWDLEVPQVFQVSGTYYLVASIMEDRTVRYWMAPRFEGPYEVPPDGGILVPKGHYAARMCHWGDLDLLWCWHESDYDWSGIRNPFGKFVVAPLVLQRHPDGSLGMGTFPAWSAYREGGMVSPVTMGESLFRGSPVRSADGWSVVCGDGMDVLATAAEAGEVWFEGVLSLEARMGGLAFRLDDQGGGYFVRLDRARSEVSLAKWLPAPHRDDRRPWFRYVELQRRHLPRKVALDKPMPFRLLVVGPYIECSIGDEVVLATLSAERITGRVGIWVECGEARMVDVKWAPMRMPQHS